MPKRLHHHAFVSADLEATRRFYEDVLGMPLIATWAEAEDAGDRRREFCHAFFGLEDGSALAFFHFDDPADRSAFAPTGTDNPYRHVALAVDEATQDAMRDRLVAAGALAHVIDHGYCRSLYTVDPDGLLVELTLDPPEVATIDAVRRADAHETLARWIAGDHTPNNDIRPH